MIVKSENKTLDFLLEEDDMRKLESLYNLGMNSVIATAVIEAKGAYSFIGKIVLGYNHVKNTENAFFKHINYHQFFKYLPDSLKIGARKAPLAILPEGARKILDGEECIENANIQTKIIIRSYDYKERKNRKEHDKKENADNYQFNS